MRNWTHKEAIAFHKDRFAAHWAAIRAWNEAHLGPAPEVENPAFAAYMASSLQGCPTKYGDDVPDKAEWPPQGWTWDYQLNDFVPLP